MFIITVIFHHPILSRSQHGSWESGNPFSACVLEGFVLEVRSTSGSYEGKKTNTFGLGRVEVVGLPKLWNIATTQPN